MSLYPHDHLLPNGLQSVNLQNGKFTNGVVGQYPPSTLPAEHINLLTDLLAHVVKAGGNEPNNHDTTQLLTSLERLIFKSAQSAMISLSQNEGEIGEFCWSFVSPDVFIKRGWYLCDGTKLSITSEAGMRWENFVRESAPDLLNNGNIELTRNIISLPNFYYNFEKESGEVLRLGRFVRAGIESEAGKVQDDAFQGHFHSNGDRPTDSFSTRNNNGAGMSLDRIGSSTPAFTVMTKDAVTDDKDNGEVRVSYETRPSNILMHPYVFLGNE